MADTTVDIKDVEVLSVGTWNGETFADADLAEIVRAFKATHADMPPRVQLGHDAKQEVARRLFPDADVSSGFPALGRVSSLSAAGGKLLASFENVPAKLAEGIKSGRWVTRSGGLFKNARIGGKSYKWMLDHVALLGDEAPAVSGLADIGLTLDVGAVDADGLVTYATDAEQTPAQVERELNRIDQQLQAMAARVNELTRGRRGNPIISTRFRSLREEIRRVVNLSDDGGDMPDPIDPTGAGPDLTLQKFKDAGQALIYIAGQLQLDPADLDAIVAAVLGKNAPAAGDGEDPAAGGAMPPEEGFMANTKTAEDTATLAAGTVPDVTLASDVAALRVELAKTQVQLASVELARKREAAELRVDADMRARGIVAGKAAPSADGTPGTDLRATLIELALLPDQSHYATVVGVAKTVPLGEIGTASGEDVNLAALEPQSRDVAMMVQLGYSDADARRMLIDSKRQDMGLPPAPATTNGQVK